MGKAHLDHFNPDLHPHEQFLTLPQNILTLTNRQARFDSQSCWMDAEVGRKKGLKNDGRLHSKEL